MPELRFPVTAMDRTARAFNSVIDRLERVADGIDSIDGKTARAEVDVETDKAEREIGEFARNMIRKLTAAARAIPDVEINADSSGTMREIASVRGALQTLANTRLGIDMSAADAMAEADRLRMRLQALDNIDLDVEMRTNLASAMAQLGTINAEVNRLDGKAANVKINVDRSLGETVIQVAALGRALATLAIPASAVALGPQLASIGAAAMSLTGVLGLLPATGIAATAAIGTLTIAFSNFGAALYQGDSAKKIEEANKALAQMPPVARETAMAVRELKAPFEDLRRAVQERFFTGMAQEVRDLSAAYFPLLRRELAGVAAELGLGARLFTNWATSAATIRNVEAILQNTRMALHEMAPAATNVSAAFLDIGMVGSQFLPELSRHANELAGRFRVFIAEARASGQLGAWIQTGIDKVAQLGQIVVNTGSIFGSIFQSANAAGMDFLGTVERITGGMARFLNSVEGSTALTSAFREIRAVIDELEPGIRAVASTIAYMITEISKSGVIREAAAALSAMAVSAAPLVRDLTDLALNVLPPVVSLIGALAPALGPAIAGFLALNLAMRGLSAVQGLLSSTALAAGLLTEKFTGSAAAGEKVAMAQSRVASAVGMAHPALMALGAAVIGITTAYEVWGPKADEVAGKVINGSMSMQAAIAAEAKQIHSNQIEWLGGMNAQESYAAASRNVQIELDKQMSQLGPMEQLQARVAMAQTALNDAVAQFGANSPQAASAADALRIAQDQLKGAQDGAAMATKTHTDMMVDQMNTAAAAANADLGYQQAVLNLADAQDRAAQAAKNHGEGSRELERANLAVQQASLQAAEQSRRKAEADAAAAGMSDTAAIGAQAYKDELIRQAATMEGPARAAIQKLIDGTNTATAATNTAEVQSRLYKDQLGQLAGQANGPLAAALRTAQGNFNTLGGAHATAEQRAAAQKAELLRLADMAQGPVKTALLGMANQIRTLPDKTVKITAQGTAEWQGRQIDVAIGGSRITATGGILGVQHGQVTSVRRFDSGGVMPGYTPGKDVHRFVSRTGGALDLSGGEAVMRPEWTRVVTPGYVHAANKAARQGGIEGVRKFMVVNPPGHTEADRGFASGGIIPHQSFAGGGMFMTGMPFPRIPPEVYNRIVPAMLNTMGPRIAAAVKSAAEQMMMGAGGGGGLGGGIVRGAVAAMMGVLRAVFPGLRLISGFRPGSITATGNRSYHSMGRAVDIPPDMRVFNWIRSNFGARTKELIFSPAGGRQVWNGRPHVYTGITRAMHFDHIHWAMRNGGIVPFANGGMVRWGDVSESKWNGLLAQGWRGRAGDRQEALYAPSGAGGGSSLGSLSLRVRKRDTGGYIEHGEAGINLSGSRERVLSPTQTRVWDQVHSATAGGVRMAGTADGGAVVGQLRLLNSQIQALRGDVDHHADHAAVAARLDVANQLLVRLGVIPQGNSGDWLMSARTNGELPPW